MRSDRGCLLISPVVYLIHYQTRFRSENLGVLSPASTALESAMLASIHLPVVYGRHQIEHILRK